MPVRQSADLSVGIKTEEELGVAIFERGSNEIPLTPVGEQIVAQAARILEEAGIKIIASKAATRWAIIWRGWAPCPPAARSFYSARARARHAAHIQESYTGDCANS